MLPDGTISQTIRGLSSLETSSSSEDAPIGAVALGGGDGVRRSGRRRRPHGPNRARCDGPCCRPSCRGRRIRSACLELLLDRVDVADADAHGGEAVVAQRLEIAVRLGSDQRGKGVGLAGDLEVLGGLVDELQEAAGLRAALVELPGRVQEPRAVAPGRGDVVALDQRLRAGARRRPRSRRSTAGSP